MEKYFDINRTGYSIKCKIIGDNFRETEHVVLYLHGFGGHKDGNTVKEFAKAALSKMKKTAVFVFDLPCHGKDVKKKLTLSDCDTYISSVLDYIVNEMHVRDICIYGTSFGGYLILKYLSERGKDNIRRIALRCPAVPMGEIMYSRILQKDEVDLLKKRGEVLAGFDRKILIDTSFLDELTAADIRKREFFDFAEDLLIIHGTGDEIVPFEESRKFSDDNVIEFIEIPGADHRFKDQNMLKLAHSHMIEFYTKTMRDIK